jgi:N6-adenosine-specific RNA methylase IME4
MTPFLTILADPPWAQPMAGKYKKTRHGRAPVLPYPSMSVAEICALDVGELAADGCHLWLWTTNAFLREGFDVMRAWGFRYLAPVHWVKPSGLGNYVIHRTQTVLLGYKGKCRFPRLRYFQNVVETGNPKRHSQKPEAFYGLIESVSGQPRLELFAREARFGWERFGNEVQNTVEIGVKNLSI